MFLLPSLYMVNESDFYYINKINNFLFYLKSTLRTHFYALINMRKTKQQIKLKKACYTGFLNCTEIKKENSKKHKTFNQQDYIYKSNFQSLDRLHALAYSQIFGLYFDLLILLISKYHQHSD